MVGRLENGNWKIENRGRGQHIVLSTVADCVSLVCANVGFNTEDTEKEHRGRREEESGPPQKAGPTGSG
jgi:hypothetical protein